MIYKDPLHVDSANLVVWHNGQERLLLNKSLLDRQLCWVNLTRILELHSERFHLEDMMNEALLMRSELDFLKLCDEYYTLIELELQEAWKFDLNRSFHRFWNRPGCSCPRLDNEDAYPTGHYVVTGTCRLHGDTSSGIEATENPGFWGGLLDAINNLTKGK